MVTVILALQFSNNFINEAEDKSVIARNKVTWQSHKKIFH